MRLHSRLIRILVAPGTCMNYAFCFYDDEAYWRLVRHEGAYYLGMMRLYSLLRSSQMRGRRRGAGGGATSQEHA